MMAMAASILRNLITRQADVVVSFVAAHSNPKTAYTFCDCASASQLFFPFVQRVIKAGHHIINLALRN